MDRPSTFGWGTSTASTTPRSCSGACGMSRGSDRSRSDPRPGASGWRSIRRGSTVPRSKDGPPRSALPVVPGAELGGLPPPWRNAKVLASAASAALLALGWLGSSLGWDEVIVASVYLASAFASALYFGREALSDLVHERQVGIESLKTLAAASRPPRREALEHPRRSGRAAADRGLRPRQDPLRERRADGQRGSPRDARVHGARDGEWPRARRSRRSRGRPLARTGPLRSCSRRSPRNGRIGRRAPTRSRSASPRSWSRRAPFPRRRRPAGRPFAGPSWLRRPSSRSCSRSGSSRLGTGTPDRPSRSEPCRSPRPRSAGIPRAPFPSRPDLRRTRCRQPRPLDSLA